MEDLTFGEQGVKMYSWKKGMTIKRTCRDDRKRDRKEDVRQNLTQRLGRDNFQEQDMR